MAINIDFNKPSMLEAYKEQTLSQHGLEKDAGRIIVGSQGGLAYLLFPGSVHELPLDISVRTGNEVLLVKNYFEAVHSYVIGADQHAKKHGFGLVRVRDKQTLTEGVRLEDFIYSACIGSVNIDSAKKFEEFLEMIKSGKGELDRQYSSLVGMGKEITRSRR
jgi:hypothetical protein